MRDIKHASFVTHSYRENDIFHLNNINNRDNCFQPYHLLRESLRHQSIEINTVDIAYPTICELHMDVQKQHADVPLYLLMLETSQIYPANSALASLNKYRKVFTWNDDLVDNERFIKINFPNPIQVHLADGFSVRNRFCCLISGNKTLSILDDRDLYVERIKTIKWFERNAPMDFDLYGVDWHVPAWGRAKLGKLLRRAFKVISNFIPMKPFPSYRGKVEHKREVLCQTKFAICYENVRDLPGYITEKIFDCFFSGCVPVYWGASNISDYIPSDCFIDRRKFRDTKEVYLFLKAMTEDEFRGYQERIATFLKSKNSYQFSSEFFAETITNVIVKDIGLQA